MRLRHAKTDRDADGFPILVLHFDKGGAAVVTCFGKKTLVDAGIITLTPLDPDRELEGFSTIVVTLDEDEPANDLELPAAGDQAATRDPTVVALVRAFLDAADDGSFVPGVQVYPSA